MVVVDNVVGLIRYPDALDIDSCGGRRVRVDNVEGIVGEPSNSERAVVRKLRVRCTRDVALELRRVLRCVKQDVTTMSANSNLLAARRPSH